MTERLRVTLLVGRLSVGGAERQLVELAGGLDKTRFDPIVATLYRGAPLDGELTAAGVRLVCLERGGKYDFTTLSKLARFLRREQVHVIQPFLTPATFFGLLAATLARTPIKIGTERGGVHRKAGELMLHPYMLAEQRLLRFADVVVPNSGSGREDLIARGIQPERIRVIYNGINPERIAVQPGEADDVRRRLAIPAGAPVIGIVARLVPMKDHETFLRAAAHVRAVLPDARFVIVGEGPLEDELRALTKTLRLEDRVIFAGRDVRVAPYVDAFDIAALSSKESEGCSNYILEAMGMGKPVVCAAIGGNPELVVDGETGRIVPASDPARLADALVSVLRDPQRARAMGANGRAAFDRRFSLERMVEAYEELYTWLWQQRAGEPAQTRRSTLAKQAKSSD